MLVYVIEPKKLKGNDKRHLIKPRKNNFTIRTMARSEGRLKTFYKHNVGQQRLFERFTRCPWMHTSPH